MIRANIYSCINNSRWLLWASLTKELAIGFCDTESFSGPRVSVVQSLAHLENTLTSLYYPRLQ